MTVHADRCTPVRVLLVKDSAVERRIIERFLQQAEGIEVVGTATNGQEALEQIAKLHPDVVCTDYHMPVMDGMELTRRIMAEDPRPVLVLSISIQPDQEHNIMKMYEVGAIEVMAKPTVEHGGLSQLDGRELAEKIRILGGIKCIKSNHKLPGLRKSLLDSGSNAEHPYQILAVGSSTGGPQALMEILPNLPANFPVPIVCAHHISNGFLAGLVSWLDEMCPLNVVLASEGSLPQRGFVYFAPETTNLIVGADCCFKMIKPKPGLYSYVPSVDVLFASVAETYRSSAVGLLLSGMGKDGAEGLAKIHRHGGKTLVQDKDSCVVFGMPGAALQNGVVDNVLPLRLISIVLNDIFRYQSAK